MRGVNTDTAKQAIENSTVEVGEEHADNAVQPKRMYIDRSHDYDSDEDDDYTSQIESNLEMLYTQYKNKKNEKNALPIVLTSKGQNMTKRKRAEREAAILKQREEEALENSEERQQERAQQYFELLAKDASSDDDSAYDSEEENAKSTSESIGKRKIKPGTTIKLMQCMLHRQRDGSVIQLSVR